MGSAGFASRGDDIWSDRAARPGGSASDSEVVPHVHATGVRFARGDAAHTRHDARGRSFMSAGEFDSQVQLAVRKAHRQPCYLHLAT